MTWSDEDRVKVEMAVLEACENTRYPNEIDDIFDGDTWIWDTYETATVIRDEIEDYCEKNGISEITEEKVRLYIAEYTKEYIQALLDKIYENVDFKIYDNSFVEIIEGDGG